MTRLSTIRRAVVIGLTGGVLGAATTADAGEPKYERMAREMVRTSADVQPGDVVVVNGGKHTIELM